ncbi:MAG TPA: NAD-dependent epimerase/dehydratase family protein [Gaiellaceae bacterium]|nr:NAD-dependent epimerase/dehydratase family protein [Gaiellaceae bacterium]
MTARVLLTGGTGFVGTAAARELRARGVEVRALVRDPERAARLVGWGVELAAGDVTDARSVAEAADGCTHAIHLVAIIRGRPAAFERVMVEGTRNVLAGARAAGVARLVHMSALGVSERTRTLTPYLAAKWRMEEDVRASELEHVILRPSFVFGRDGGVLPTLVRQVRLSPVVTVVGSGRQRFQPVWVDDVAAHLAAALDAPAAANRTLELGGPDVVDWNELYSRIARALGRRRALVHVPAGLVRAGAGLAGWIPGSPLTADQVTMLVDSGDNVVAGPAAAETFGLPLVRLDEQLRRAV